MWVSVDLSRFHQYGVEAMRRRVIAGGDDISESLRQLGMEVQAGGTPFEIAATGATIVVAWGRPVFTDEIAAREVQSNG